MTRRKIAFATGAYYHIYNRGTDKRKIVLDQHDINRFLLGLEVFNTECAIGGVHQSSLKFRSRGSKVELKVPLVEVVAYNILDNHYHLLLRQLHDDGISKFMQRMGGGFTKYFNEKYERSGVLFQGPFKSAHVSSDARLVQLSAYINLNHLIHKLRTPTSQWSNRSSWGQYIGKSSRQDGAHAYRKVPVTQDIILGQFSNAASYEREAARIVQDIIAERADIEKPLLIDPA